MLNDQETYFLNTMSYRLSGDIGLQDIGKEFSDKLRTELPTVSDVDIAKVLTALAQMGMHIHDALQTAEAFRDCPLHGLLRIMACSAVQLSELERELPTKDH